MDNVSRNLLRLLTATCGFNEARLMAVQRLEMWLQNPKVPRLPPPPPPLGVPPPLPVCGGLLVSKVLIRIIRNGLDSG